MANEIKISGIGDLIAGEVMAAEYLMLLANREDFFGHSALHYAGAARGSNVVRTAELGLGGYDLLSAGTEGTALTNTALTDSSSDVTVAWYGKSYEQSDIARVAANGLLDPVLFAQDAAVSLAQTLVDLIASLASGYSNTVGSTGVDMTAANYVDATTQLEISKVSGPLMCILHPRQWGDVKSAFLTLGGAAQYRTDAQGVFSGMGQYKGTLMGADVFVTAHVDTANTAADYAGMMFGKGAVIWADAEFPSDGDPNIVSLGRGALERVRTGKAGLTAYVTHAFLGVTEGIDAAGVGIITDA